MIEHVVGTRESLPPGAHTVVRVGRREIGVFNVAGEYYGLPNICPHQAGPLCERNRLTGTVRADVDEHRRVRPRWVNDGEIIQCPWHGLEFHVPTGECVAFPEIRLRHYEVFVDGDLVKVRV